MSAAPARRGLAIVAGPDDPEGRAHAPASAAPSVRARRDLRDEDLHDLLVAFYDTVAEDPMLAPYFAPVDMRVHMPKIVDFWSTILFESGRYAGNAFRPHAAMPGLTAEHFARWLAVLERTVGERFVGPAADRMLDMGHRIAFSMQVRLGIVPRG